MDDSHFLGGTSKVKIRTEFACGGASWIKVGVGLVWLAATALAQSPQTYTLDPSSVTPQFNPFTPSSHCQAGSLSPKISGMSVTFTVNMTCDTGFAANGTVNFTFSESTVTGTVGPPNDPGDDGVLNITTPLVMTASANLTYTGGGDSFSASFLDISGAVGGASCVKSFPGTNPENVAITTCSISQLDLDPNFGGKPEAGLTLLIYHGQSEPFEGYLIELVFDPPSSSTGCEDARPSFAHDAAPVCVAPAIQMTFVKPASTEPILALADNLPPFCISGNYTYTGTKAVHIAVRLLDSAMTDLASSVTTTIPSGTNVPYGSCADPINTAEWLIIPAAPIVTSLSPVYQVPAKAAYNQVLGMVALEAFLEDADLNTLATSNPVIYNVEPGVDATTTLRLYERRSLLGIGYDDVDPTKASVYGGAYLGDAIGQSTGASGDDLYAHTDIDFAGSSGNLTVQVQALDASSPTPNVLLTRTTAPVSIAQGDSMGVLGPTIPVDAIAPPGVAVVNFQTQLTTDIGQVIHLPNPIQIKGEGLKISTIVPGPSTCTPKSVNSCLLEGVRPGVVGPNSAAVPVNNTIQIGGSVTASIQGETIARVVQIETSTTPVILPPAVLSTMPAAGKATPFQDVFQVSTPYDVHSITITYYLLRPSQTVPAVGPCACSSDFRKYGSFTPPSKVVLTTALQQATPQQIASGELSNIVAKVNAQIISSQAKVGIGFGALTSTTLQSLGGVQDFLPHARQAASASNPPYIGIGRTWEFDTAVPHNGSFSAAMSLDYAATDLPDDPNFVESQMQIISLDSTGTLHVYQTTVDTTNKIATATVDGLDNLFSLAVIGPFTSSQVQIANAPTNYALVNTGTQSASLTVTNYDAAGNPTPAQSTLPAGQLTQTQPTGVSVEAAANSLTVAGVSWFDNGAQFAVIPGSAPDSLFLISDVEYDSQTSTEIDIANVSLDTTFVTMNLFGSDGSAQGTYQVNVASKASISVRVDGIFPGLMTGFSGYLSIESGTPIVASGIRWSGSTATGLVAQPVNINTLAVNTLYVPQLGGATTATTLHLVNVSGGTANITLKAWGANGTAAASNFTMQLQSGQEYTASIPGIFNLASTTVGSLEVDSSAPGIFGDVLVQDASFTPAYAVSLALTSQGAAMSVFPYATSQTTLSIFNPGSTAASATATPYGANGAAGTPSTMSIPANGLGTIAVSSSGYVAINSNAPVVAAAAMVVASGATTGYLSIPITVPSSSGGGGSGGGSTTGGGGSSTCATTTYNIEFGQVPVGSYSTNTLNLTNPDSSTLTIASLSSSSSEFAILSPSTPFNIAPGATTAVMMQFTPTSTGDQCSTITLTDPPHPSQTYIAHGVGTSSSTGTGGGTTGGGGTTVSPQITAGGVVNAAGYAAKVSRGALAFAFGNNLAPQFAQAQSIPLPYNQGGTSVTVAGIPAAVFITDPTFVEFQVPYEVPLGTSIPVVVTYNGVPSNTVNVTVADYAVGVFVYNRTPTIIDPDVFHTNGTLLTPSSPAIPSETVIVIANGIGKLNNPPATDAAVGPPYPTAVDTPVVTVGGVPAVSQYAGLLAGLLGVVQMNVQLPANLPSGSLPLVIQFPGDSSPPVNLYVAGNIAAAPKIGVTPSSLSFGSVTVGQNSSLALAISNNGSAALTISSITSSNGAFAATSPATPFTVQPGGSTAVTVMFSPTAAGSQSGNLTISSNDPASPQFTVAVSGTGTAAAVPSITTSPSTLAFGSVTVGKPQSQTLTINNVGTATLSVSSISSSNAVFTPGATSASVAAGASFNVSVQFAPTAAGPQTGTLTLATNDPAHATVTVALTGTGVTGAGTTINSTLTITGSGTSSGGIITATGTVTLSGVGTGTFSSNFSLTSAALSGSAPITITITSGSPAGTLTAALSGSSSLLSQIFAGTPTASGPATITVSSGTGGFAGATGSFNVTASGTGAGTTGSGGGSFSITGPGTLTIPGSSGSGTPTISAPTTTLQLGSVTVGQTANVPFNISNTGTAALTVSAIASSSASVTVTSPAIPFTVQPGATTPVTVTFAPTAAGAVNGILTITSNDPAHPNVMVSLSGTGVAASGSTTVTLSVDGGSFNNAVGFPGSTNAVFVNRLTPPSYPATLTAIAIYFGNRTTGLAAGTTFTLVAATNPSGSASFSASTLGVPTLYAAGVSALGVFNVYTLPTPITITSGDFVVGLATSPDPPGIYPADEDQITRSQGRSYVSTDGINFAVVDSFSAGVAGNFGIRAVVTLAGSP